MVAFLPLRGGVRPRGDTATDARRQRSSDYLARVKVLRHQAIAATSSYRPGMRRRSMVSPMRA